MNTLYYILLSVYVFAINFYGILMLKLQKKAREEGEEQSKGVSDARLIFASLMGGALGVYVFMFIFKYRIRSIVLMTLIPVLVALNIFAYIFLFKNRFGIVV